MIYGIGTDLVDLDRNWGNNFDRLCAKVLSSNELLLLDGLSESHKKRVFAKQWACKESVAKALGTGFVGKVIPSNMEILRDYMGKPVMIPCSQLRELMDQEGISKCHLSISDTKNHVFSVAILETV